MRRLVTITALACAALLLAAPVGAGEADDQQVADDVVAEVPNLIPEGWEEDTQAQNENPQTPPECEKLRATVEAAEEGPFAEVTYGDPADSIGLTEVTASVYVFPKAKQAKKFAKELTSDASRTCIEASAALLGGGTVEDLALNNAEGFEISAESQGFVLLIQQTRARAGRAVVTLSGASEAEPLPFIEDLSTGLEDAVKAAL